MIITNKAECHSCEDVIQSMFRHDYQTCKCGNLFVDGGRDYLRRGGPAFGDGSWTDLSEVTDDEQGWDDVDKT